MLTQLIKISPPNTRLLVQLMLKDWMSARNSGESAFFGAEQALVINFTTMLCTSRRIATDSECTVAKSVFLRSRAISTDVLDTENCHFKVVIQYRRDLPNIELDPKICFPLSLPEATCLEALPLNGEMRLKTRYGQQGKLVAVSGRVLRRSRCVPQSNLTCPFSGNFCSQVELHFEVESLKVRSTNSEWLLASVECSLASKWNFTLVKFQLDTR